jgi:hypothetical protein
VRRGFCSSGVLPRSRQANSRRQLHSARVPDRARAGGHGGRCVRRARARPDGAVDSCSGGLAKIAETDELADRVRTRGETTSARRLRETSLKREAEGLSGHELSPNGRRRAGTGPSCGFENFERVVVWRKPHDTIVTTSALAWGAGDVLCADRAAGPTAAQAWRQHGGDRRPRRIVPTS